MIEITVCMGSSCYSRGNEGSKTLIEEFISSNNLEDKVDFRGMLCSGKCGVGPNVIIDGKEYNHIEEGVLLDILNRTFEEYL